MPAKQVLGFNQAPQLEQIDDEHSDQATIDSITCHDATILHHEANPAGWNLRKGQPVANDTADFMTPDGRGDVHTGSAHVT